MSDFEFLKKYVFDVDDNNASESKHSFYNLSLEDILEAEKRLGFTFPHELRDFFINIGYGFLCNQSQDMFDRFMDPGSIADFRLCEDMYGINQKWEYYDENFLVFFEVSEESFISIDLSSVNTDGKGPVYYFETKIADSIKEFLEKMDEKIDYYLDYK